jgi:hypothetical protein
MSAFNLLFLFGLGLARQEELVIVTAIHDESGTLQVKLGRL